MKANERKRKTNLAIRLKSIGLLFVLIFDDVQYSNDQKSDDLWSVNLFVCLFVLILQLNGRIFYIYVCVCLNKTIEN